MFIIDSSTLNGEFHKSSWAHDFDRFETLCNSGVGIDKDGNERPATKDDLIFAEEFTERMEDALNFAKKHMDCINAYIAVKQMLTSNAVSPSDFEYGIFGNIIAGSICPFEDGHPVPLTGSHIDNIECMASIGYIPAIRKIVSNEPFTVVYFADDSKVTVRCDGNDKFDAKTGVYLALLKKAIGGKNLRHLFKLLSNVIVPAETLKGYNVPDDMELVNIDDWNKTIETSDTNGEVNPEIMKFVDMCFDPKSPIYGRLKQTLAKMLEKNENMRTALCAGCSGDIVSADSPADENAVPDDMESVSVDSWDEKAEISDTDSPACQNDGSGVNPCASR